MLQYCLFLSLSKCWSGVLDSLFSSSSMQRLKYLMLLFPWNAWDYVSHYDCMQNHSTLHPEWIRAQMVRYELGYTWNGTITKENMRLNTCNIPSFLITFFYNIWWWNFLINSVFSDTELVWLILFRVTFTMVSFYDYII